jgi:clan AA aspartic protease
MGLVYTEITLRNAIDIAKADEGLIDEQSIRQTTIDALVDTGAWTLVINEAVREKLGIKAKRTAPGTLADGTQAVYNLAGPLEVRWKDRATNCDALVLPDAEDVLLGAIPLEAMDLTVNLRSEEVVGVHGDQVMHSVK